MKYLIINGDDYGMNERCSRAVAQAFREGVITDTTMMANGAYFDEAVSLAVKQGFVNNIGVHLNVTEGNPLTEEIRHIPDFVTDGHFHKGYVRRPRPLSNAEQAAVYAELSAQVHKIRSAGIRVTHADSHHYIHCLPAVAPIAAAVCRDNGIAKIRLQRNLGNADGFEQMNGYWKAQGFITTRYFGRMSDIPEGQLSGHTEIMVHPDFDKNGVLIDRRGTEEGFPTGNPLCRLENLHGAVMGSYSRLS